MNPSRYLSVPLALMLCLSPFLPSVSAQPDAVASDQPITGLIQHQSVERQNLMNHQIQSVWLQPTYEKKLYEVGQRLVDANHMPYPVLFRLSDEKDESFNEVNAHAESDHKVIQVGNGLFRYIRSDDELAAVLSHELGHILLGKSGWIIMPQSGIGLFDLIGNIIYLPDAISTSWSFGKKAARFFTRGTSQKNEIQADLAGIELMVRAGYNPMALESILTQISSDDGNKHWRSRVLVSERIKTIHAAIASKYPQFLTAQGQATPAPTDLTPDMQQFPDIIKTDGALKPASQN